MNHEEGNVSSLHDRLSKLISAAPVMLFMKGTVAAPKCKFSRQMVELLNEESIQFSTFDILEDEDVQQGLKEYSNWPSYPQLYVRNELIGGLDILKEMRLNGDIKSQLGIINGSLLYS